MTDKYRMLDNKLIWHPDILAKWRKGETFFPIHLDIGATSQCNYRCVHCFYDYLQHAHRSLTREVLIPLMRDIAEVGVRSIFFASQGEPLLNPTTPEAIITASKLGVDVAISSNGYLFTKELSEEILPYLKWVRISALALSKDIYSKLHRVSEKICQTKFDNLIAMAEVAQTKNLSTVLGVQTCLLPENGDDIVQLASFLKRIGFTYITIRPISNHPLNAYKVNDDLLVKFKENLRKAEELSDEKFSVVVRWNLNEKTKPYSKCLGLPFIAFVNADGGVYTCGVHLDEEKYCYGNLYQERFPDIWLSKKRKELTEYSSNHTDFNTCDLICRHHAINKFLWQYAQVPPHVNFI